MEGRVSSRSAAVEAVKKSVVLPKNTENSKAKMQRVKASHPSTAEMVKTAIKELKDHKGSSLQAIKKYVTATYKIDGEKASPFIKRYLKAALISGAVLQSKGKGASGSFKLPIKASEVKAKNQAMIAKSIRKPNSRKVTNLKKMPANRKKPSPLKKDVKPVSAAKMKTKVKQISKTTKTVKVLPAKTRTPKPKKATTIKAKKIVAKK
ncbi:histone H1A, sperm-like [Colletes gigas]|uniref:histone H1A, sperm-like n=1 Tax=Colletes gigas TaxID=935657 RepID=UPI001C9A3CAD|nr:histone H1A, sperm-like [Colletes gigas]